MIATGVVVKQTTQGNDEQRRQELLQWANDKSPYRVGKRFQRAYFGIDAWEITGVSVEQGESGDLEIVYTIRRLYPERYSDAEQRIPHKHMATIVNSVA